MARGASGGGGQDPLATWLRGLDAEGTPTEWARTQAGPDPGAVGPVVLTPNPEDGPVDGEPLAGSWFRDALRAATGLARTGRGFAELSNNVRRYLEFNREKLAWLYQALRPKDRTTFSVIPYLLHVNLPDLPGHLDPDPGGGAISAAQLGGVPSGLSEFELNATIRFALDELFPSRGRGAARTGPPAVKALLAMGSVGTIGQSRKSDIDYWVVVDEAALGEVALARLRDRLADIESWANARGLDAHFFVVDEERARQNEFGSSEADAESSGSAQGKLLKEEFYRTAVFISGALPLWWVAPVGVDETGYTRLVTAVERAALPAGLDFVDLGFIGRIDPGEFFGAALWQINKSLRSPFKSLLKMALLARYLDTEPGQEKPLLCDQLKARVFGGDQGSFTDPYVLLFDAISEYFAEKGDWDAFRLVQKCFYLKVGLKLSRQGAERARFMRRFRVMRAYIARWGWDAELLAELDSLETWSAEKVDALGQQIRELMLGLYRGLVQRARAAAVKINENDVTILGRRLFACFGNEPGRIRHLFTYFLREPRSEDRLMVIESQRADRPRWAVHRHAAPTAFTQLEPPMWTGASLAQAGAWLTFNGLFHRGTVVGLMARRSQRSTAELRGLLERFHGLFETPDPFAIPPAHFLAARHTRRVALVVNFDADEPESGGADDVIYVPQNWDVLNYGPERQSTLLDVSLVTLDTWGEVFCRRFAGPLALPRAMRALFAELDPAHPLDREPEVLAPHDRSLPAVRRRLGELVTDLGDVIGSALEPSESRCFVYEVSGRFQVIERGPNRTRICSARSRAGVLRLLGDIDTTRRLLTLDRLSPTLTDLRALLDRHLDDREAGVYVGWRLTPTGDGEVLVCDETRRFHLTQVSKRHLDATLLRVVRRVLERLRGHVRSARQLRRALRVFELREGLTLGGDAKIAEDTVRVLEQLARPRPGHVELRLRGDFRAGRQGLELGYGDRVFSPRRQGRRWLFEAVQVLLNDRGRHDPELLRITASDVEFGPEFAADGGDGHDRGVVKHLRLVDAVEDWLKRALKAYLGDRRRVLVSTNDYEGVPRS